MDTKIKEFLVGELKLDQKHSYYEKAKELDNTIAELDTCRSYLNNIRTECYQSFCKGIFDQVENKIRADSEIGPKIKECTKVWGKWANYLAIPTVFRSVIIAVEITGNSNAKLALYHGLIMQDKDPRKKDEDLYKLIEENREQIKYDKFSPYSDWYYLTDVTTLTKDNSYTDEHAQQIIVGIQKLMGVLVESKWPQE